MAYPFTEADLKAAGLRTDSPAQPFPTRAYACQLPNGNTFYFCPRPGATVATEFTSRRLPVAKHSLYSLYDLQESVAGRGQRTLLQVSQEVD